MKARAIYGPPGCGKTTTVLSRIDDMIRFGIPQNQIGFMSYTKAAAEEAKTRVGVERSNNFSTIHSLCYRLVDVTRDAVISWAHKQEFSKVIGVPISGRQMDEDGVSEGDEYLAVISLANNRRIPYDEAYHDHSDHPGSFDMFMVFAEAYDKWRRSHGIIDFDDMLAMVLKTKINYRVRNLVVDESQDLSPLQWAVIDRLVEVANPDTVTIAGDDDQAIHEWAGADPHGMFKFESKHGAEREVLTQSWRVPKSVHAVAGDVIGQVKNRVPKEYNSRQEPGVINSWNGIDMVDLAHGQDTLILARTHSVLDEAEKMVQEQFLPYTKVGGKPGMLNNRYFLAIQAWLGVQADRELSQSEYKNLKTCVAEVDRRAMEEGDFRFILNGTWQKGLVIPYRFSQYYNHVDFKTAPTIRLSTIHGAKGKEASRVVLMTSMTEKVRNSVYSNPDAEARVWYVGVTRAKDQLDIVHDADGYDIRGAR